MQNQSLPGIAAEVLAILRCLDCQSGHCQSGLRQEDDALVCVDCARRYPIVKGVTRFVDQQSYTGSFGFQWQWRVPDTFDWYSPWYQSKHTYEQVFRWFESCGLQDLTVGDVPVAVRGRKPAAQKLQSLAPAQEAESCAG